MGNSSGLNGSPKLPQSKKKSMSPSIFEKTHTKLFQDSQEVKKNILQKAIEEQKVFAETQLKQAPFPVAQNYKNHQSMSAERRPEAFYAGFKTKVPHKTKSSVQKNDINLKTNLTKSNYKKPNGGGGAN